MGKSSFYDNQINYQVIDASTAGSSFYGEGPGYAQVDPDGIKHLKDLAEAAAVAAEASNVSAAAHDASSALHDASATAHDISAAARDASAALHDSNAEASASAAATSEGNAYVSASNAHASDVSSAANAAIATAQAGIATTKASQASTSETNAATSETNSHTSEVNAAASAAAAAATLAGALTKANNLLDLTNVGTAKTNLGLNNVDNTSDVNKPVSTAQQTALDLKQSISGRGTANGYASLDAGGKIPTGQLPAIAITDTFVVSSQSAMLALSSAEQGDVAIRTDINKSFILATNSYSTLADWKELLSPTTGVASVAGLSGTVSAAALKSALTLSKSDVGLGNVDNTSDVNKPVSTAQQSALDAKASLSAVRDKLTANRNYYVATTGSDNNDGRSVGTPFLTIQKAINSAAALDLSTYSVTINVSAGTYSTGAVVTGPWGGSGDVILVGDTSTPANVVVNVTGDAFTVRTGGRLALGGFKINSTGVGLRSNSGSAINVTGLMEFGTNSSYYAYADTNGSVNFFANFTLSGNAFAAFGVASFGSITIASRAATLTGTPAYGSAFASAGTMGLIVANGFSFTGSATGPRYSATTGGGIFTFGGGANFFPGNSTGNATAPGWYN